MVLSSDLVRVDRIQKALECLNRKKLQLSQGKVVTPGPWQIFDVPTKVTDGFFNFSMNYVHCSHSTCWHKLSYYLKHCLQYPTSIVNA